MSRWLAEDPELLAAALDIIDTWDGGFYSKDDVRSPLVTVEPGGADESDSAEECLSSSSSSSSSSVKSPSVDPLGPVTPPRLASLVITPMQLDESEATPRKELKLSTQRSTQHRRRKEIDLLRSQAAELQRQLVHIKNGRQTRRTFQADEMQDDAQRMGYPEIHPMHAVVWQDIAFKQQQLRIIAESTRIKLRARIEAQVKLVRAMVKLMRKARKLEAETMVEPVTSRIGTLQIQPHRPNAISEADQFKRIEAMHDNIDVVFSTPEFNLRKRNLMDVQLLQDQPNQFIIDVTEAWAVPFEHYRVTDALWDFSVTRLENKWCATGSVQILHDKSLRVTDTEIVSEMSSLATIGSASGRFDGRAIAKRFVEVSPAIVTDFYFSANNSDAGDFTGLRTHEQSCLRVVPIVSSTSNRSISSVQFRQRFTISFDRDRAHADLFAQFMLVKLKECVEIMHETVETTLLLTANTRDIRLVH